MVEKEIHSIGKDSEGESKVCPQIEKVQTLPVAHSAAAPAGPRDFSGASAGNNHPIAHKERIQTSHCAI
jgi:hypothetical protein